MYERNDDANSIIEFADVVHAFMRDHDGGICVSKKSRHGHTGYEIEYCDRICTYGTGLHERS